MPNGWGVRSKVRIMRAADDPFRDYKALVQEGYDGCAAAYEAARSQEPAPELALLTGRLSDTATVLDVGCGAGVPVALSLTRRFSVTGVDISAEMIRRARANVPSGTFVHGDIMAVEFSPASFDAVVGFYSIFHLPRQQHHELLRRIYGWLKPGGYLLATVAADAEALYIEDDFFGITMYWSSYGLPDYLAMLDELGFDLLESTIIGAGYGKSHEASEERHPLVFAQKRGRSQVSLAQEGSHGQKCVITRLP